MVVATQIVTAEPVVEQKVTQYEVTPEDKLQKAIYILENEDPDYNLISGYFHVPDQGYCVQGLLFELSGVGHWQETGALGCFYLIDESKDWGEFGGFRFLSTYYSLSNTDNPLQNLMVDESKLPEETRAWCSEITDAAAKQGHYADDGRHFLATINNIGIEIGHPHIRKVLADILRYKAFV